MGQVPVCQCVGLRQKEGKPVVDLMVPRTRGERNVLWIETYCRVPEGKHVGQPVLLRQWQIDAICSIYDQETRRVILSFARKNGKGLRLDTPILTTRGWTTMGEIKVGDFVYGANGKETQVTFVSEVHTGLRCWKLTFSDGSTIIADEEHQWKTAHRYRPWANARVSGSGNGGRYRTEVLTTPQIAMSVQIKRTDGGFEANHKIECAPAICSRAIALPLSPYVLGLWLGDGTAAQAVITGNELDIDFLAGEIEKELGVKVELAHSVERAPQIRLSHNGFLGKLRELALLNNKHIPASYLEAGTEQRWALLQGLMDSDGTVTQHAGRTTARASFTTVRKELAQQVWQLARSLGLKATLREGVAKLYGRVTGPRFEVSFTAAKSEPVFRLERKQSLLPESIGKRSRTLTIIACDEVLSSATRCIQVAAADSMFLCGKGMIPTHNTAIAAMLLLLHLCGPEALPNSQLFSAAQSLDQAALLFSLAAKMVRLSPDLSQYIHIKDSKKELICKELGSIYKALSAEAGTAFGKSPCFLVHDELGQVKGPRSPLYEALETACGAQESPLSVIISTQAPTDADLLSVLIDDALAGKDPRVRLILYTAPQDLDPFEEETIKLANPAYGDFQNAVEVMATAADAKRMPSREPEYRNLVLNQRVEMNAPFVSAATWKLSGAQPRELDSAMPVYGGLDLSSTGDLTALVLVSPEQDGFFGVYPTFWLPENGLTDRARHDKEPYDLWHGDGHIRLTPGAAIEYEFIAQYLREFFDTHNVRAIAFDRYNWKFLKPWLEKAKFSEEELLRFVEFGQGFISMSPALRSTEALLLNGKLKHGGNPVLQMCARNAVVQQVAGNRKLNKDKSRGRIDGMVSLVMAVSVAETYASPIVGSIYGDEEEYGKAVAGGALAAQAPPGAAAPTGTSLAVWNPDVLANPSHPEHNEHVELFNAWQEEHADDDESAHFAL